MDQRTQTQRVVDRFGSRHRMREATGHSEHTIQNWIRSGTIPEKYWLGILLDARREEIPLNPFDFVAHTADALTRAIAEEMRAQTSAESVASSAVPA